MVQGLEGYIPEAGAEPLGVAPHHFPSSCHTGLLSIPIKGRFFLSVMYPFSCLMLPLLLGSQFRGGKAVSDFKVHSGVWVDH